MGKYPNKIVTNRKSPSNERAYISAYKELNPTARKSDKLDVAAVKTKNGVYGHTLMNQSANRSKDRNNHVGQGFISDKELRRQMKK